MDASRRTLITGAVAGAALGALDLATGAPALASGSRLSPGGVYVHTGKLMQYGSHGANVLALRTRLNALGYWNGTPSSGFWQLTQQAVWALQKAAGLPRDGAVGPETSAALAKGVRPRWRTRSGTAIEIDKAHQLLLVVSGGKLRYTLNTSTGGGYWYRTSGGGLAYAHTPSGSFSIYSRYTYGWQNGFLGAMWRPTYFHGGYAIHGSSSIPPRPASHGCARLSTRGMDMLYAGGWVPVGRKVIVY